MFCSFKPPLESLATVEETVVRDKVRQLNLCYICTCTVFILLLFLGHITCTPFHGHSIILLIYLVSIEKWLQNRENSLEILVANAQFLVAGHNFWPCETLPSKLIWNPVEHACVVLHFVQHIIISFVNTQAVESLRTIAAEHSTQDLENHFVPLVKRLSQGLSGST